MADEFDFAELIAAPIKAANDAQADAAANFAEQLERFAFKPRSAEGTTGSENLPRELQQIKFNAHTGLDENGQTAKQEIAMPLLQLVPLSGLLIEDAKIEFECDLKARERANSAPSTAAVAMRAYAAANLDAAEVAAALARPSQRAPIALAGSLAPTVGSDSGQSNGNLKVEINLKKADLPSGYLDMLANTPATTVPSESDLGTESGAGSNQNGSDGTGGGTDVEVDPVETAREITNKELFDVRLVESSGDYIAPGKEFECIIDVRYPEEFGEFGPLELELDAEPVTYFSVLNHRRPLHLKAGRQRLEVKIYADSRLREYKRTKRATLTLAGAAIGKDGVRNVLTRRIEIPLKRVSPTKEGKRNDQRT